MKPFSISGRALIGNEFVQATLVIADGQIVTLRRGSDPRADICATAWIAPGLIDLQVNGAYGFDFTVDSTTIPQVAARLPETGVTAFLPTIITSPLDAYPRFMRDVERAASTDVRGAHVLGAHLEGPYLNAKRVGAHNPNHLRAPNRAELETWAGSPLTRVATVAPELPDALDLIRELRARGIVVSAGHSDANYAQARASFDAGITWSTHLFNAMPPFSHREPGLIGALLSSDVPVGLIADGVHVHPAALKTVFRAKGARGITLVTDAMMAMGMGPGHYTLGDRKVIVDTSVARLNAETLAGSILQMDTAVRNMIEYTGCSLAEALTMASATPARVLGLQSKGRLAENCDADLVIFDKSLRIEMTIVRGEIVYKSKA
jgi:N-acetylglucosamine-6-phosphate deacetylase